MKPVVGIAGILLVLVVLWDIFETIVLPRAVRRRLRPTQVFYRVTWAPWAALARRVRSRKRQEGFLALFGPLSLIVLLALWMVALIVGFAAIQWGFGDLREANGHAVDFGATLYMSGTTLLTLGLGDIVAHGATGRLLTVFEVAMGFGVLALVIGYLPVLYQAFSRREVRVSLLDARAGSPPTAGEIVARHFQPDNLARVTLFLREWELWAAELMEGHLSYPVLAYYRSQHEGQSWLAALTVILDASALIMAGTESEALRAARLTFATARHAMVDLAQVLLAAPYPSDRLPPEEQERLLAALAAADVPFRFDTEAERKLTKLRSMYEPYAVGLARNLVMPLPPWAPTDASRDYWRSIGGH